MRLAFSLKTNFFSSLPSFLVSPSISSLFLIPASLTAAASWRLVSVTPAANCDGLLPTPNGNVYADWLDLNSCRVTIVSTPGLPSTPTL